MTSILYPIISGVIFFSLAWFLSKKNQQHKFNVQLIVNDKEYKNRELKLKEEQALIVSKNLQTKQSDMNEKEAKLNNAFLENGRTVELIATELINAQETVDNAFASLPNIYTCSQRTNEATKTGKIKIDALSDSVDSWQGSMQTLENIQGLIDAIHDKAIQIRDVSAEANLLALNASIEAARAGEHGRGFAVVATSMRELSNKSADATLEINTAVEETRSEVGKIINGISDSVALLGEVSSDVSESFSGIEKEVGNIDNISQTSLTEADAAKDKFSEINKQINSQLENITRLLADTLGVVTGNSIENVSVSDDFSNMIIIDVRRVDEFNGELGHITGAKLFCLQDDFEQKIQQLDKTKAHLFVCRSGGRSARAARIALGSGFKHIFNMQGGMLEYCKVNGTPTGTSTSITPTRTSTSSLGAFMDSAS